MISVICMHPFTMVRHCNICTCSILSHSYFLSCSSCPVNCHIQCLPDISKTDSLYTERYNNKCLCLQCTNSVFPFNHILENVAFIEAQADQWTKELNLSLSELSERIFHPFELNDDANVSPLFKMDPDLQYYNKVSNGAHNNCDYYLENMCFF
jgi:hypothetical protein